MDRLDGVAHFFGLDDVVDHKGIGHVVHEAEPEDPDDELEEVLVVLIADAVVEVATVVVEAGDAAVALATVLGAGEYVGVADLAVVIVVGRVESYAVPFTVYFQLDCWVGRIFHGRQVAVIGSANS